MFEKDSITFLGIKSHSILRYILKRKKESITEFPSEVIREMLLKYVHEGVVRKEDVAYRNKKYPIYDENQDGGTEIAFKAGNTLLLYLETTSYAGIPDAGAVIMMAYSEYVTSLTISTPNLTTNNGVVHALDYNQEFGKI